MAHFENGILAALAPADAERVVPHLRPVEIRQRTVLHEPGRPVKAVYFLESGMISLLATSSRGPEIEVAVVGPEGMCGMALFHDVKTPADKAIVQVSGRGHIMDAADFTLCLAAAPSLRRALHHYSYAMYGLAAQASACNRRHHAVQRLARWLLITHDRIGRQDLPLTHEFLAQMLGVRRSTVTVIAEELRSAGIIHYTRGSVRILDRDALDKTTCDCYRAIVRSFEAAQVPVVRRPAPLPA